MDPEEVSSFIYPDSSYNSDGGSKTGESPRSSDVQLTHQNSKDSGIDVSSKSTGKYWIA